MYTRAVIIHYTAVVVCGKTALKGIVGNHERIIYGIKYKCIICVYVCMYIRVLLYSKSFNVKHLMFRVFTGSSGGQRTER